MSNLQAIDLLKDLEQSLDDYCELNDEGKTAFRMAITALELFGNSEQLPSVQPDSKESSCTHKALDTISRQAAIDAIYHHFPSVSRTRARTMLHEAPSAQPEIIRCKDCKHRYLDGMIWNCPFGLSGGEDFFCAYGVIGGGSGT